MKKRSTKCTDNLAATVRVRVPFFDLDPGGVVWHGRYFQYFELARSAVLEFIGYSYEEMASGVLWPVTDSTARYLRPLASPEILIGRVRTRLREIGPTEP